MENIELLGFLAGSLVAISLLPQLIKSWTTKSVNDVSMLWMVINITGQFLWMMYGYFIESASLLAMSGITLVFALSLLYLKIKY